MKVFLEGGCLGEAMDCSLEEKVKSSGSEGAKGRTHMQPGPV
jgi:hypothetical protein